MRIFSSPFVLLTLAVLSTGCATTVRPVEKPIDPVPVFLTDYGVHSSLMLPTPDGRYVEYSFGDFGYAAMNKGGPHNALGALLVSNQAGIGRRFLSVRPGEELPRPAYAPKSFQKFFAERFQVYALVKQLDQRYRRGRDEPIHNAITDNVFVKDDQHYSIANNCNHMTGRMLRELGCEVSGDTGSSAFKIVGTQQIPEPIDTSGYATSTTPQVTPAPRAKSARVPRRDATARSASFTKTDLN
jgi:hypothetical protein